MRCEQAAGTNPEVESIKWCAGSSKGSTICAVAADEDPLVVERPTRGCTGARDLSRPSVVALAAQFRVELVGQGRRPVALHRLGLR